MEKPADASFDKSLYSQLFAGMSSTTFGTRSSAESKIRSESIAFRPGSNPRPSWRMAGRACLSGCPTCYSSNGCPSTTRWCSPRPCATSGRPDVQLVFVPTRRPPEATPPSRPRSPPSAADGYDVPTPMTTACPVTTARRQPDPALHLRHLHRRAVESVRARRLPRRRGNAVAFV